MDEKLNKIAKTLGASDDLLNDLADESQGLQDDISAIVGLVQEKRLAAAEIKQAITTSAEATIVSNESSKELGQEQKELSASSTETPEENEELDF